MSEIRIISLVYIILGIALGIAIDNICHTLQKADDAYVAKHQKSTR